MGVLIRRSVEALVRRFRRPDFIIDPSVGAGAVLSLAFELALSFLRGLRVLFAGKIPRLLLLGRGVRFFNLAGVRFGKGVRLGDGVYVSALGREGVTLGDHVSIGAYSRLVVSTTFGDPGRGIEIGDRVGIGEFAHLGGAGGLVIGPDTIAGPYLSAHPENHVFDDPGALIREQGVTRRGIRVGANCWIGAKVTLLDGAEVGDNCVIAAGAVVRGKFPANVVLGGVPARILKHRRTHAAHLGQRV
ncbi:MAG TPA: acyltransferase [Planctomycetota bacterium]|nr:acyltransferase [Planctomycetota bacterium]